MLLSAINWFLERGWSVSFHRQPDGRVLVRAVRGTDKGEDQHLSECGRSIEAAVGQLLERIEP